MTRSRLHSLGLAVLIACALAALMWPRSDDQVPGGFLVDASGRPRPLGEELAPTTLLHFWATWCPPCVTEIPALVRLAEELEAPGQFRVLLVAVNDSPDQAAKFLGSAAGRALHDPSWEIAHRYSTRQLPETHLLVQSKVVKTWVGATNWDDPAVRQELAAQLGASATRPARL